MHFRDDSFEGLQSLEQQQQQQQSTQDEKEDNNEVKSTDVELAVTPPVPEPETPKKTQIKYKEIK